MLLTESRIWTQERTATLGSHTSRFIVSRLAFSYKMNSDSKATLKVLKMEGCATRRDWLESASIHLSAST